MNMDMSAVTERAVDVSKFLKYAVLQSGEEAEELCDKIITYMYLTSISLVKQFISPRSKVHGHMQAQYVAGRVTL